MPEQCQVRRHKLRSLETNRRQALSDVPTIVAHAKNVISAYSVTLKFRRHRVLHLVSDVGHAFNRFQCVGKWNGEDDRTSRLQNAKNLRDARYVIPPWAKIAER